MEGQTFDEDYIFTQIARRVFNEFLELKLRVEGLVDPGQHEKALEQYRTANKKLKLLLQDQANEVERLSALVEGLERERDDLRLQLNETVIKAQLVDKFDRHAKEHKGVPFTELMSEESFSEWRKLITEIPRNANRA